MKKIEDDEDNDGNKEDDVEKDGKEKMKMVKR